MSAREATVAFGSFMALGDSFTEGMGDPRPGGGYRGWADLVAGSLARAEPDLRYANLAVRGRLLGQIVDDQLPAALAAGPGLVSIAGGGNDMLRPSCDLDAVGRTLATAIRRLAGTGARVIAFYGFDPTHRLPGGRWVAGRARRLNDVARDTAAEVGATLVDLWVMPELADPRVWSVDRLHLGPVGHQLVARAVLDALAVPGATLDRPELPVAGPRSWLADRRQDALWSTRYFAPWLRRRLTGRSSGDGVAAKIPELVPVAQALGQSPSTAPTRHALQPAGGPAAVSR